MSLVMFFRLFALFRLTYLNGNTSGERNELSSGCAFPDLNKYGEALVLKCECQSGMKRSARIWPSWS